MYCVAGAGICVVFQVLSSSSSVCPPVPPRSSRQESSPVPDGETGAVLSLKKTDDPDNQAVPKEEKTEEPAPWPAFTGPVNLQKLQPRSYVLPDSFLIGPLADSLSPRPEERQAVYVAGTFWDKFRNGRSLTSLLASYPHPLFQEELKEYAQQGREIKAVELGRFSSGGRSGQMRCLVCSDSGCLEGTLYLVRENDAWFIEDWEIPFRDWPGEPPGREEDRVAPPVSW